MARRDKEDEFDFLEELLDMQELLPFCCCPECGDECSIDSVQHGKNSDISSIEFTCHKCGHFATDHNPSNGEWKLRDSGLLYLPEVDGNDFTLYQRFDESAYPGRREALEAKYELMESIMQPILDSKAVEFFERFENEIFVCCKELSDMGVRRFKGILARFLLTRGSEGRNVFPLDAKHLEEIESLVSETDYDGMFEALSTAVSIRLCGLDSGIDISQWSDMLVDKRIEETESLSESERVVAYLGTAVFLQTIQDAGRAHRFAVMAIDLIRKNISTIENADDLLAEAYSCTDHSSNSYEMSKEIFEHFHGCFEDYPEECASALFEMCLKSVEHPEEKEQLFAHLDEFIKEFDDEILFPSFLAKAYHVRYCVTGRKTDLQKAFDIVTDSDEFGCDYEEDVSVSEICIDYLRSIRRDNRRISKALRKLGMQGMSVDEAIDCLTRFWSRYPPRFY